MKLQKLAYYSKAWHLVWEGKSLFPDDIEAWANGPVVRSLYDMHKGMFVVVPGVFGGDATQLSIDEVSSVDAVLGFYGDYTPFDLSEQTHREAPWRAARAGLQPGERGDSVITEASMAEYYESL